MSTALDLYQAEYFAAHKAYGDLPSGRPAMSKAFQDSLVVSWLGLATKQFGGSVDDITWGGLPGAPTEVSAQLSALVIYRDVDTSYADDIWQIVGTLAGVLAYYQLPGPIDEALAGLKSAAAGGLAGVEAAMSKVASAASSALTTVLIVVAVAAVGYLLLRKELGL